MSSPTTLQKFELLRRIFRLSQEQNRALEADLLERFAELMAEREQLIGELLAMEPAPEDLPENVIPFPGRAAASARPSGRTVSDDEVALASVIRGILYLDERNESLLREKMGQVREALGEISRGRAAAQSYRQRVAALRPTVDRAG
ncbi:MAG TPA: flagellar protein FliT [Dehalococcoidia bacterium]